MKNESFLFSFEDHDGSISIAAAVPPTRSRNVSSTKECAHDNSSSRLCPVVLSLHGTGVDVQMQADSYPTNLRRGGKRCATIYVWSAKCMARSRNERRSPQLGIYWASYCIESPGVSSFYCRKNVPSLPGVDVERVLFAGHSMGGHGSWVQFIHNPDRAIGAGVDRWMGTKGSVW